MTRRITSMKDAWVKRCHMATSFCDDQPSLLLDEAACRWAHEADVAISMAFICERSADTERLQAWCEQVAIPFHLVSVGIMQKIKQTKYASPIVAIAQTQSLRCDMPQHESLLPVLESLQDPGNCGSIFRSMAAFAVSSCVVVGKMPVFHKKSISASRGAVFRMRYCCLDDVATTIAQCLQQAYTIWVTSASAQAVDVSQAVLTRPKHLALVVGNERDGHDAAWHDAMQQAVTLPMHRSVESLNVAVATSIFLYCLRAKEAA